MAIGPVYEAESEIAALFQLPPEAFVNARNALAASLKKDGHAEASARVKALPKPPVSVWAVNQLHWRRTPVLDRLIAAGDRFRQTQTARLTGGGADLRESFDERRDALAAAVSAVTEILRASGHTPSPDLLRRITTTLEALATLGTTAFAPPRGRLIADLAPQGFEALSALIPRGAAAGPDDASTERGAVVPFGPPGTRAADGAAPTAAQVRRDEQAARAAAARALRALERELAVAQTALKRAQVAMKAATARAKAATRARAAIERTKATVDRRHAAATGKAEAALAAAHARARAAEEAAEAVQQAERGVRLARERAEGR
ncbi:MAG: hypothetical protein AB7P67_02700 [Vicinamibacterales bacterium]